MTDDKSAEIYAVFNHPTYGYSHDEASARKANLKVGERYPLERAEVGGFHTSIWLVGIEGSFNSVQFDFADENGNDVDICRIPEFRCF